MTTFSSRSRTVAAILAFFFGALGVHRFYCGKIGSGIVQLLLAISFIGTIFAGIWALVDLIMILSGKFKDIEGREVKNW